MKTRQEMIYDFMVSLAGNPNLYELTPAGDDFSESNPCEVLYKIASGLTDFYLKNAS